MKEIKVAFLEFRPPDILYVRMKNLGEELGVPDYLELLEEAKKTMGLKKHFLMLDMKGIHVNFGPEVRAMKANDAYLQAYRIGEAFLIDSLPMRLMANVFIAVNKPKVPTRYFQDEASAMRWIDQLRGGNSRPNGQKDSAMMFSI